MKICTKCGARMSDSNRFCEKCGSTLVTETAAGHTAVPVRSETSLSQLVGWLQKYGRHIMRVAALLAVVLFFCPLFLVSCEGVQMNVSGFQTATGFGFDDDGNTKSSWFLSEEDNSRYYTQDNASLPQGSLTAFAALLLAGGMLGSTFVLAQNASRTEQKNVHGVQIALAAAHVAALLYIFDRPHRGHGLGELYHGGADRLVQAGCGPDDLVSDRGSGVPGGSGRRHGQRRAACARSACPGPCAAAQHGAVQRTPPGCPGAAQCPGRAPGAGRRRGHALCVPHPPGRGEERSRAPARPGTGTGTVLADG